VTLDNSQEDTRESRYPESTPATIILLLIDFDFRSQTLRNQTLRNQTLRNQTLRNQTLRNQTLRNQTLKSPSCAVLTVAGIISHYRIVRK
jgi:uncharacterized protein YjbI with pentapeptide repeats